MKKNKISCIYKIICINNKFYIGSAIDINRRLKDHRELLRKNIHPNPYLQNTWNKYGEKNFRFEIMETVHDINQLLTREKWWIDTTDCCNRKVGFNISLNPLAPMRGRKHSEKTKQKMRLARKGKVMSEEHRNKMKLIGLAQRGRKFSKERRENISRGHMGIVCSEGTKLKLSLAGKKYYSIKENRDRLSKRLIGRKVSEETRRKISEANKGKSKNSQQQTKKDIIISTIPQLTQLAKEKKSFCQISKDIQISSNTLKKWLKILDPNLYELFVVNGKKRMGINKKNILGQNKIIEIENLLNKGNLTQRKIAKLTNVSQGSVSKINISIQYPEES